MVTPPMTTAEHFAAVGALAREVSAAYGDIFRQVGAAMADVGRKLKPLADALEEQDRKPRAQPAQSFWTIDPTKSRRS